MDSAANSPAKKQAKTQASDPAQWTGWIRVKLYPAGQDEPPVSLPCVELETPRGPAFVVPAQYTYKHVVRPRYWLLRRQQGWPDKPPKDPAAPPGSHSRKTWRGYPRGYKPLVPNARRAEPERFELASSQRHKGARAVAFYRRLRSHNLLPQSTASETLWVDARLMAELYPVAADLLDDVCACLKVRACEGRALGTAGGAGGAHARSRQGWSAVR